jgi:hypothetical protein
VPSIQWFPPPPLDPASLTGIPIVLWLAESEYRKRDDLNRIKPMVRVPRGRHRRRKSERIWPRVCTVCCRSVHQRWS